MWFKCCKGSHVALTCTTDSTLVRIYYGCGGVGHFTRYCSKCSAKSTSVASVTTFSNAVASAWRRAHQVFTEDVINNLRIVDALFDTSVAFSMYSTSMFSRLQSEPAIQPLTNSAFNVVGVIVASAKIRSCVAEPVTLNWTTVYQPLLIGKTLAFPMLIVINIFRLYNAILKFDNLVSLGCLRVP